MFVLEKYSCWIIETFEFTSALKVPKVQFLHSYFLNVMEMDNCIETGCFGRIIERINNNRSQVKSLKC